MNKLYQYIAMLCTLVGNGNIFAIERHHGIDYSHIKLSGKERIILVQDQMGITKWAAVVTRKMDRELVSRALQPLNNVYDLRELQRSLPLFTRYKGMLGLAVGLIMGAAGLDIIAQLFHESPEIDDHC